MRKYEMVLVMNPDLSEADLKTELGKIESQLQGFGASAIRNDRWGKKELGYQMRKRSVGNYVCLFFETENSTLMSEITNLLRINDHVLKFQSHRISDRVRKVKVNPRRQIEGLEEMDSLDGDFAAA